MNVHDELVLQCKKEDQERAAAAMQDCMENTVKLSLDLTAVPQIGEKYSDVK